MVHHFIKTLPKEVIVQAAKQLGLYYKKSIAVETEQALDVLFNHTIFHHLHNTKYCLEQGVLDNIGFVEQQSDLQLATNL